MTQEHTDAPLPVKPFLVYVGRVYYPGAVNEDLACSCDSFEEACREAALRTDPGDEYEWWSVVDHATMQVLADGSGTERSDYT